MEFTAKDVAALRASSGAGMMDCKKALVACDFSPMALSRVNFYFNALFICTVG